MRATIDNRIRLLTQQLLPKLQDPILSTQYAWWIMQAITHQSEAELISGNCAELTTQQEQTLNDWVRKIIVDDMPLQYILGDVPFGDVTIIVRPPVLIPRPETEEWCMWLINKLTFLHNKNLTIIEPCTGSGCIAVVLGHALPFATIYATDISDEAVALTRENAQYNNVQHTITCIQSDLFDTIPLDIQADLIIANPPYIAESECVHLDASVINWEDKRALIAADNGLALIKKIIHQAPIRLKYNPEMALHHIPQLMIEIGHTQAATVVALMQQAHYTAIQVHKDLAGKDRVVSGRVAHAEHTTL